MTNFTFLPNRFSEISAAAMKAEGHIHGDPRAACFHARFAPGNAAFVPPPADRVADLLGDLERFIHNQARALPPLVRIALAHAQFETIHPFLDGNGRTGRLLIAALLE